MEWKSHDETLIDLELWILQNVPRLTWSTATQVEELLYGKPTNFDVVWPEMRREIAERMAREARNQKVIGQGDGFVMMW